MGRFIALHINSVSKVPEEPTNVPATIIERLCRTKPSPATASPVKEFSSEITTGMSAPPIGITIATPKTSASRNMTTNAIRLLVCPATRNPASPSMTSRIRPFNKFCPGNVCGFSNFPSSLRKAMMLPENDSEPISVENSMGRAPETAIVPTCASRRNSMLATSAAAPPPRPLNAATICGIAVIFTE